MWGLDQALWRRETGDERRRLRIKAFQHDVDYESHMRFYYVRGFIPQFSLSLSLANTHTHALPIESYIYLLRLAYRILHLSVRIVRRGLLKNRKSMTITERAVTHLCLARWPPPRGEPRWLAKGPGSSFTTWGSSRTKPNTTSLLPVSLSAWSHQCLLKVQNQVRQIWRMYKGILSLATYVQWNRSPRKKMRAFLSSQYRIALTPITWI